MPNVDTTVPIKSEYNVLQNITPLIMDNLLSKEEFWDSLKAQYPVEMDTFLKWIDRYKSINDWNDLFALGDEQRTPKYHELPIALQIGIFSQFMNEMQGRDFPKMCQAVITEYFRLLREERQINATQNPN